jgi:hypothetical protein
MSNSKKKRGRGTYQKGVDYKRPVQLTQPTHSDFKSREGRIGDRRGQVTIFVIVAVIIVAVVIGFFIFRGGLFSSQIPASIEPVYTTFLSCLEEDVLTGIGILGAHGGYIELPEFEPGSEFMPFSSYLDFIGNPIPYWYYVSGSNIQKSQVPSRSEMENQLADYIEEKIINCRFNEYYEQGFIITLDVENIDATTRISEEDVSVDLKMGVVFENGEDRAVTNNHKLKVKSHLGKLYDISREIYDYEQDSLFLEEYAIDTLRLYAPVDGVEISCSPKVWAAEEVSNDLRDAIELNTGSLRVNGGDFSLSDKEEKYFVVDVPGVGSGDGVDVRFLNSKDWPYSFEVFPSEGETLISNPVGNQPGLGILGFCYVPYHFVYNVKYPVLIQVSSDLASGGEIFQFPLAVVIQGNKEREALDTDAVDFGLPKLCEYKNTEIEVNVFDTDLGRIDANIAFECFGTRCGIGETSGGRLVDDFPQCVNGYVLANAEGFEKGKQLHSSTTPGIVDIILDRLYEMEIDLKLDGASYGGEAIVSFVSDGKSKTILYPDQKSLELSEGQYEVRVDIFKDSQLVFPSTTKEECIEVPRSGIGSVLGLTKEKCFDIEFPEQVISNVLAGGGNQNHFILESELQSSTTIEIGAQSLPSPRNLDQLQDNYNIFEERGLGIVLR